MRRSAVLSVLAISLLLSAWKQPIKWEAAKVIAQDLGSEQAGAYQAPIGSATVAVPLYRRWNIIELETENAWLKLQESGVNFIVLAVDGEVKFYREKEDFVILDSKNKKHKFRIIGMKARARG